MQGNHRTNDEGKIHSILLLDNEHENIADLEMLLRKIGNKLFADNHSVQYASSPDEALRKMMQMQRRKEGYSAIIAGNHMDADTEDGVVDTIDGQDFLRVVKGYFGYCLSHDPSDLYMGNFTRFKTFKDFADEILGKTMRRRSSQRAGFIEFMERNFDTPTIYQEFLQYYTFERVEPPCMLMLCGHPRFIDCQGLDEVPMIQKAEKCELQVADYLREEGIINNGEIEESIEEHPRFSTRASAKKIKDYNPGASHVRRFLRRGKYAR